MDPRLLACSEWRRPWQPAGFDPALTMRDIRCQRRTVMSLGTILIVILLLMLLGVLPTWSHSANWGYLPSSGLGLLLVVLVVLVVVGRI
jgi:hypothetical protein